MGGFAAERDAVGDAYSLVGVAGLIEARDGGGALFHFPEAGGMADGVLRHGTRPAEDAREARFGDDACNLAQLGGDGRDDGVVGLVEDGGVSHAAQEAARQNSAGGDAVGELGAYPGAGYQAIALLLGNQEAETIGRIG